MTVAAEPTVTSDNPDQGRIRGAGRYMIRKHMLGPRRWRRADPDAMMPPMSITITDVALVALAIIMLWAKVDGWG